MKACPCSESHRTRRIVLNGGLGAGKTAVLERLWFAKLKREAKA